MIIDITWLDDYYDCETCGGGGAEGGRVHINGVCVVDMEPSAHCYDSTSYSQYQVYEALFQHLGLVTEFKEMYERARYNEDIFKDELINLGYTVNEQHDSVYEPSSDDDDYYGDNSSDDEEGQGA